MLARLFDCQTKRLAHVHVQGIVLSLPDVPYFALHDPCALFEGNFERLGEDVMFVGIVYGAGPGAQQAL